MAGGDPRTDRPRLGAAVLYVQAAAARDVAALKRSLHEVPFAPGISCPAHDEASFVRVRDQGCRALPALIGELDPAGDPYYNYLLSNLLRIVAGSAAARDPGGFGKQAYDTLPWIEKAESPGDRPKKAELLRAWWREHGHAFHQRWRIWSVRC